MRFHSVKRAAALLCALVLLVSALYISADYAETNSTFAQSAFAKAYSEMAQKYNITGADTDEEPYALCRLLVTGYQDDDYGAVAKAISGSTAILQYETPEQAAQAAKSFARMGIAAEADGYCETEALEAGALCPWASELVGTAGYIKNCRMRQSDVLVAQIDTGIMMQHPAVAGRFVCAGYDFSSDGAETADYDAACRGTSYWHGTAVASVLANNTSDCVKLLPYKVIAFGTSVCTASAVIAAMRDAIDRGVDVMNLSLSTYQDGETFKALLKEAYSKGICVCCSAGNDSAEIKNRYPSAVAEAIAVSAVDADCELSGFSNYGGMVDFCAPGSKINVATIDGDGNTGYCTASGTSLSSPYVAACCAMLKSIRADLSVEEVICLLQTCAVDLGDSGFDIFYGYGLPNVSEIVQSGDCGAAATYTLKLPQGELEISGSGEMRDYTKAADRPWHAFAASLTQVTVANGITAVGAHAFDGLSAADVSAPDCLTSVGPYAFQNCAKLTLLTFDQNIRLIGTGAFYGCTALTVRGWQNTPAELAAQAAGAAFESLGCLHNYVCKIIEPTETQNGILQYTCSVCSDSYSEPFAAPAVLGSGSCGDGVHWSCYSTGQLVISGAGAMADYAQQDAPWTDWADKINSVFIENGVTEVSPFAFAACSSVTAFSASDCSLVSDGGVLYNADKTELVCYPGGKNAAAFTIPETVTEVNAAAFLSANRLRSIDVAGDFFSVSETGLLYAEEGTQLVMALPQFHAERLVLEAEKTVHANAFLPCDSLNTLVLLSDVQLAPHSVGYGFSGSFYNRNLTVYGLEDSAAQQYCKAVLSFLPVNRGECGAHLTWTYDLDSACLTIAGSGSMTAYQSAEDVPWQVFAARMRKADVSDETESLSPYAFYGCGSLMELCLPAQLSVTADPTVFFGCNQVETLTLYAGNGVLPDTAENASYSIMSMSSAHLKAVTFCEGIQSIGARAFFGCAALRSVTLPDSVTSIHSRAFHSCSMLASVDIGSGIRDFGYYVFYNDKALKSVTIQATEARFTPRLFGDVPADMVLYAYYDTTAMTYCEENDIVFSPLGCLHRIYRDEGAAPTCTAGAVVRRYCGRCNADLGDVQLPAAGHRYTETVLTAPDCTNPGLSLYTCSVCAQAYQQQTDPLQHENETLSYTAPTCCTAGSASYHCLRCDTYTDVVLPALDTVHYVKGTVTDKAGAALQDIQVACDGVLVARTNENGVFMFDGVKCGRHTLTFSGGDCVPAQTSLVVSGSNVTAAENVQMLCGDLNGDGWVNARDYALAEMKGYTLSAGADKSVLNDNTQCAFALDYGVQAEIGLRYIKNTPDEASAYRRCFEANVRAANEYTVLACGFIYGKNMDPDMLTPAHVGEKNADGYAVKQTDYTAGSGRKILVYGASDSAGKVSARFYIRYTNGVFVRTYLSEVTEYVYA